ncbi:hypothetical protein GCM10010195_51590 [Kitasatospora griseola]|nr:hypothetical protein GCM10010195_51590 [Kitasatospora griseola]
MVDSLVGGPLDVHRGSFVVAENNTFSRYATLSDALGRVGSIGDASAGWVSRVGNTGCAPLVSGNSGDGLPGCSGNHAAAAAFRSANPASLARQRRVCVGFASGGRRSSGGDGQ